MAPRQPTDVLRGPLDLLVMKALSPGPLHGWGISQRVQQVSQGVLTGPGRRAPGAELESWRRFAAGLEAVLRTA